MFPGTVTAIIGRFAPLSSTNFGRAKAEGVDRYGPEGLDRAESTDSVHAHRRLVPSTFGVQLALGQSARGLAGVRVDINST